MVQLIRKPVFSISTKKIPWNFVPPKKETGAILSILNPEP